MRNAGWSSSADGISRSVALHSSMFRFIKHLFRRTDNYNKSIIDQLRQGGVGTASTVRVNETTAMNLVAVYAAVRALSEDIASVPFPVYQRLPNGGKNRDRSHPLYTLLNDSPDNEISAMQWREYQVKCLQLYGNAYNEIEFTNGGDVRYIHRLDPKKVEPKREAGGIIYKVEGTDQPIPANRMLHIAGLGDGLVGMSPIKHAQQTIAAGMMMDQFAAAWFANGSRGALALTHPGQLSPQAQQTLRDQIDNVHGGPLNAGKVWIFEEGMTASAIVGAARGGAVSRLACFRRAGDRANVSHPLFSFLQENSNCAVRANTEQEYINYAVYSLRPWMVRIEKEVNRKLFRQSEQQTYFAEHLLDAIHRGEAGARTAALKEQFLNGALTIDEWREIENRNPLPNDLGKQHFIPLNMTTVEAMTAGHQQGASRPAAPAKRTTDARARSIRPRTTSPGRRPGRSPCR